MIFEGPEKKLELLVSPGVPSLRRRGREFWDRVVARSRAQILSTLQSDLCDAYLLSESSLFVYDHRVVMITCGTTTLVSSVLELLEHVPSDGIESLIYERKNEHFPLMQPTSFEDDVAVLQEKLGGETVCFGDAKGHHIWLYSMGRPFQPDPLDTTLEMLMHDISAEAADRFRKEGEDLSIRRETGLDRLLPGFAVDDHLFDPCGYSLNALLGDQYYTLHVTPQNPGSYVSFETNYRFRRGEIPDTVERLVDLFQPGRFDVLLFQDRTSLESLHPDYLVVSQDARVLRCGYRVQFGHFGKQPEGSSHLEMTS